MRRPRPQAAAIPAGGKAGRMGEGVSLSILGFAAFGVFLALVLTKRLSAVVALILVPVIFGALAGFSPQLGEMMIEGVKAVAPTSLMLIFALLYFAVMIEAGLFEPWSARCSPWRARIRCASRWARRSWP